MHTHSQLLNTVLYRWRQIGTLMFLAVVMQDADKVEVMLILRCSSHLLADKTRMVPGRPHVFIIPLRDLEKDDRSGFFWFPQDRIVKARLLECLPSCRTFLDVDGEHATSRVKLVPLDARVMMI